MAPQLFTSAIRKGKFLWMEVDAQRKYLSDLRTRIKSGYFSTDSVIDKVVEDLAPIFDQSTEAKVSGGE